MARVFNEYGQKTKCAYAAPIIGYMNGWDERQIQSYCRTRGWDLKFFEDR